MTKTSKEFTNWLKEKKLSVQGFCAKCNPIVDYNTAVAWKKGHMPRELIKSLLHKQWPDCPLFK